MAEAVVMEADLLHALARRRDMDSKMIQQRNARFFLERSNATSRIYH